MVRTVAGIKLVSLAIDAVKNSTEAAFRRIDTMEQFSRTMTAITGSSAVADTMLKAVNETVIGTAYGLDVAAKATQSFVTSGMDTTTATQHIGSLADAVSFYGDGTNASLQSASEAWAKMAASGKVYSRDVNTLIFGSGIPAWQIYADAVGMSVEDVRDATKSGEIDAAQFQSVLSDALTNGTENFQSVAGAAQEAGTSWAGTFDNMRAATARGTAAMFTSIDKNLVSNGLPNMREGLLQGAQTFEKFLTSAGNVAGGIVKFLSPALKVLSDNMDTVTKVVGISVTGLVAYKVALGVQSTVKALSVATQGFAVALKSADFAQTILTSGVKAGTVAQQLATAMTQKSAVTEGVRIAAKKAGLIVDKEGTLVTAAGTIATEAEAAAVVKSATAISTKSVLAGVLSGQITVATAVQHLWNAALNANPIGIVVVAVTALIAGLAILSETMGDTNEVAKKTREELEETKESIDDINASFEDNKKEIYGSAFAAEQYADELATLEGKIKAMEGAGKDTTNEHRRYALVVGELNKLVPSLNLKIDEKTGLVKEDTSAIKENINEWKKNAIIQVTMAKNSELMEEYGEAAYSVWEAEQKLGEIESKNNTIAERKESISKRRNELQDEHLKQLNEEGSALGVSIINNAELSGEYTELTERLEALTNEEANNEIQMDELNEVIAEGKTVVSEAEGEVEKLEEGLASMTEQSGETSDKVAADAAEMAGAVIEVTQGQAEVIKTLAEKYTFLKDSAGDMFNTIDEKGKFTLAEMIANMQANQDAIDNWATNVQTLTARGIDEGLLAKLQEGTEESIQLAHHLVNATDEELAKMNELYANRGQLANDALAQSLGLPDGIVASVAELADISNQTLREQIEAADFTGAGADVVQGYVQGIVSEKQAASNALVDMAGESNADFADAIGTQSPSTVYKEFGKNTMQGYILGVEGMSAKVSESFRKVVTNANKVSETTAKEIPKTLEKSITPSLEGIRTWGTKLNTALRTDMRIATTTVKDGTKTIPTDILQNINPAISQTRAWGARLARVGKSGADALSRNVKSAVAGLPSDMYRLGQNLPDSMMRGMQSKRSGFYNNVYNFFEGVSRQAKNALDIKSPSRVMREIGKNTAEGYIQGLKSMNEKVGNVVTGVFTPDIKSGKIGGLGHSDQTLASGGSRNMHVTQNIYANDATPHEQQIYAEMMIRKAVWGA